ncbi:uncharacterized protein BJ171DRAFT_439592 [Polychytrium aggregatum]|uniref:uncharacterized protein n=1 Tax=Polychytrium aggregatum TaxID=110093 RepID=UPI0022FE97C0|nr:uncharacterized protein BJ171DRAFT_439592 [Polychytrium aggregatum]KAI9207310.1 hypothetical protein BJ171DRAFT_439592 [Polychytrium aggregatum]
MPGVQKPVLIKQLQHALTQGTKLADPRRLGSIPFEYAHLRNSIPTLMHGKRIAFGTITSEKSEIKTRRPFYPNVIYSFQRSNYLDMNVLLRLSTEALRQIERAGGLDSYLLTVDPEFVKDPCAIAFRKRVFEEFEKKKDELRRKEMDALKGFGPDYIMKLKENYWRFDTYLLKKK